MMQHNPYDLIIIKENVVPHKHIEELMLLTNNKEQISQATVINRDCLLYTSPSPRDRG